MQDQSAEARKAFGIKLRDLRRDAVLTYAFGDMAAMNERFDFLARVTCLPNVALGGHPSWLLQALGGCHG
ncbi:hypothetical protein AB0395_15980 [Streptosporangium sp. NPDC051023]|uniref:hypothetical protein n=1 Tax=Streptosporangium sp. NPDC051023 TaxID=3155410 RepID=UPI00344D485C